MNSLRKIQDVLQKKPIPMGLVYIPSRGATQEELNETEKNISRSLPQEIKLILNKWNGLHLDIINFFGCGNTEGSINNIEENQLENYGYENDLGLLSFADDPSGYLYLIDEAGQIYSFDLKLNKLDSMANSLDEFICEIVFGPRAKDFAGEEWMNDLVKSGLIN